MTGTGRFDLTLHYEPIPPREFVLDSQITLVGTTADDPDAFAARGAYSLLTAIVPEPAGLWEVERRNVLDLAP